MFRKLTILVISIGINACANSNTEQKSLTMSCEVQNEYGSIGCGIVPLSINKEISKKFKDECPFENKSVDDNYINCLRNHKEKPLEAFKLGNIEFYGNHVKQDIKNGLDLIKFSSDQKYPEAMVWLAKFYDSLGETDKSFKLIKEAAQLENPLAMYSLGFRYSKGIGVNADKEIAFKWLNESKEYVPAAYSEMATIYLNDGDVNKFIEYNNKALDEKYWFANVELAVLYLGGVPGYEGYRDLEKSKKYAQELINKKISVGYFIDAQILEIESNKIPNSKICELYKQAYDGGFMLAGINLSSEYLLGNNCSKNYESALKIFRNIFLNTIGETKIMSATNLGYMYLNGLGVPVDLNKSKEYLQYASNLGYQPAIDMLSQIQ
ncbi:tetratricopeptide repeat protein [Acinetobacter guillouiae]|uniref:SEL1-like repeat protein n=1 Tax=Acinetobacter guillouiae TaxID=106649 RepID=UPI0028E46BF1|nr:tetratricopeptide repeat protein [Acinetobacter guillouiae]